jgi:hypothetical protein
MNLDGVYSLSLRQGYYGYATERIFESKIQQALLLQQATDGWSAPPNRYYRFGGRPSGVNKIPFISAATLS